MNTYKVIKIEGTLIYLGKDDGTLLKVEQTSFNFVPQLVCTTIRGYSRGVQI